MVSALKRVLVTSLGSIGRRHLNNVRQLLPQAMVGVLRLTSAPSLIEPPPDQVFASLAEALNFRPDFVIIASPASEHLALAKAFVSAGIPVLVEKPFASKSDGLAALVEQAETDEVHMRIAYNLRYHPLLRQLKTLLDTQAIGRVMSIRVEAGQYLPDWRPHNRYQDGVSANPLLGGGALLELSHELDYIIWLFGKPTSIQAAGGTLGDLELEVEDTATLLMTYEEPRRIATVHLDFLQRAASRTCKLVGTQGTILADLLTGRLDIYGAADGEWREQHWSVRNGNQTYQDELAAFVSLLAGGGCELPDGRQGLSVMAMIEAARQSMATGQRVRVRA